MPITRRKRANPPDQPENNHHQPADPTEGAVEQPLHAEAAPAPTPADEAGNTEQPEQGAVAAPTNQANGAQAQPQPQVPPNGDRSAPGPDAVPPPPTPLIEGGRRTSRGELFRRPPQPPTVPPQQQASFVSSAPLQAPTHEITLPLGNLLHLAYNPGYTGSEEARSLLLQRLSEESKAGGRARCWNCGSLAIAYDRWTTRNRTFGDVGVAFCEICGVWSVL